MKLPDDLAGEDTLEEQAHSVLDGLLNFTSGLPGGLNGPDGIRVKTRVTWTAPDGARWGLTLEQDPEDDEDDDPDDPVLNDPDVL